MSKDLEEGEKALPGLFRQIIIPRVGIPPVISGRGRCISFLAVVAALCVTLLGAQAMAQEPGPVTGSGDTLAGDEVIELEPVIVLGEEIVSEREVENPSKFMTVIDVSGSSDRVETVSEVLSETVGVQVKSWGGMGGFSTVSIRGSSASQVQVFIDGVPLNRAVSGVTNLEDLPLDNVEYIEVFRGFTPADFGSSGIGGAVNLVTRREVKGGEASASYGSFDTYKLDATASGPAGPLRLLMFAGYGRSRGNFEYENDNGTPLVGSDDFEEERTNNDFESFDLTGRVSGGGPWEFSAVGSGHSKEQGLPGLGAAQAEDARLETNRGSLSVSVRNRSLLDGGLDLTLGGDGLWENQVYDDPEGELGSGGPRKTENVMSTAGARVKSIWRFAGNDGIATGYLEYREETYLPVEHVPNRWEGDVQRRNLAAGVIQVEATDPSGLWTLQATVRQERYWNMIKGDPNFSWSQSAGDNHDTFDLTSPSVGLRYRAGDDLVFKANGGRFYRVPTFYELFGDRGVAVGNTDLDPESGVNWDIGFTYRGSGGGPVERPYLEYAYFQSRIDDLILFFQNSQRTVMATNIGGALITGHEVAFGLGLFESVRFSGNYTFQAAVDKGEVPYWRDNALPFRPMHEAYGKIQYQPWERAKTWADVTYVSGNYWDRANLYEVPDRRIYNLGATVEVWRREDTALALTLEGKNLADERVSDVAGYPLPGRSYYATVQFKW